MSINPVDIRHHEFRRTMRGFDPVEVEQYLNEVADQMEQLLNKNEELERRAREVSAKLESYTSVENAISQTLVNTKQSAEKMMEASQKEAEIIIKKAHNDADEIVRQSVEKVNEMRQDIRRLEDRKMAFVAELRNMLRTHLEILENIEKGNSREQRLASVRSQMSEEDIDRIAGEFE
ncbi:MAG: DivIVA domain-containing protein [candidate division Zixibacteria bacterium]|nr:DivIVA domain-containing protein [candidate division Zixibacteria bacterium]